MARRTLHRKPKLALELRIALTPAGHATATVTTATITVKPQAAEWFGA